MKSLMQPLYLPGVESDLKPGVYRTLIESARKNGTEYSKIWDLFAFQQEFTVHLSRFSEGVLRKPASISPGMRELIAARRRTPRRLPRCWAARISCGALCAI